MASLDRNDLEAGKLIRKVLRHDDDEMRSTAAYFVDKLPLKDSRKQIKELLADKVDSVRWSAILNINELCTVEDRDWLAGLLAAETNEENRKLMEEKIGQLKSERE
jgi:HEAT repeat protein